MQVVGNIVIVVCRRYVRLTRNPILRSLWSLSVWLMDALPPVRSNCTRDGNQSPKVLAK